MKLKRRPPTNRIFSKLYDKNRNPIYEGDITKLILPWGEIRLFEVVFKTSVRKELICHEGFDDRTAKVAITGFTFVWNNFDLFLCIDENGVPDNEKMEVVGNIYENPLILERHNKALAKVQTPETAQPQEKRDDNI